SPGSCSSRKHRLTRSLCDRPAWHSRRACRTTPAELSPTRQLKPATVPEHRNELSSVRAGQPIDCWTAYAPEADIWPNGPAPRRLPDGTCSSRAAAGVGGPPSAESAGRNKEKNSSEPDC